MAIASELPFTLEFIKEYDHAITLCCSLFYDNIEEALKSSLPTVSFQENDPISIAFSAPADGRLYLDALDIIPSEYGCTMDDDGRIYYGSSNKVLPLYKLDGNEFDELRVDNFLIEVRTLGASYFGWLQIEPKQLLHKEWEIMVTDLESTAIGLSQDIVQRNIGFGKFDSIAVPPRQLRQFLILKNRAACFLTALYDIADNPRFTIKTEYLRIDRTKDIKMDLKSIREELRRPHQSRYVLAPNKITCYDTQENRQLKKIVNYCVEQIKEFNSTVSKLIAADIGNQTPYASGYTGTPRIPVYPGLSVHG